MSSNRPAQHSVSDANLQRARALHGSAVVINALDCTPLPYADAKYTEKLRRSGVTAVNHAVSVSQGPEAALEGIVAWQRRYRELGDTMFQARTLEDLQIAKAQGRVALYMGFEDTAQLGGHLPMLDVYWQLGLRFLGLTYQYRNHVGDGSGEPAPAGLSRFGRMVVEACNELGVVIDLSHTSEPSSLDAIERSSEPVLVTHSCVRARVDSPRNKTDREIEALAAHGGVMCIAAKSGFMSPTGLENGTTVQDYVDQIDYVADLVGIDHVGVGTDIGDERKYTEAAMREVHRKYPEIPIVGDDLNLRVIHPDGLDSPGSLFNITSALVERGYGDDDIRKVIGGNVARVLGQIWRGHD